MGGGSPQYPRNRPCVPDSRPGPNWLDRGRRPESQRAVGCGCHLRFGWLRWRGLRGPTDGVDVRSRVKRSTESRPRSSPSTAAHPGRRIRPGLQVRNERHPMNTQSAAVPRVATGRDDFAELSRKVRDGGLMVRRRGYYAVKIGATVIALFALGATALLLGNSWWNLVVAVGHGLRARPTRLHRPRRRPPSDLRPPTTQRRDRAASSPTCSPGSASGGG